MQKILIIEDDELLRAELTIFLTKYGYAIEAPTDFSQIMPLVQTSQADLILLDLNLPVFDGHYICREIRQQSQIPIIIVTSRDSDADELMSMHLGADDFITKPYHTQILLARIASVLKRSTPTTKTQNRLVYQDLVVDLATAQLHYAGQSCEISKNEQKMMAYLMMHQGTIVSREALIDYLWETDCFVDDSTLSVTMSRLRKKLAELGLPDVIQTKRGQGYLLG